MNRTQAEIDRLEFLVGNSCQGCIGKTDLSYFSFLFLIIFSSKRAFPLLELQGNNIARVSTSLGRPSGGCFPGHFRNQPSTSLGNVLGNDPVVTGQDVWLTHADCSFGERRSADSLEITSVCIIGTVGGEAECKKKKIRKALMSEQTFRH